MGKSTINRHVKLPEGTLLLDWKPQSGGIVGGVCDDMVTLRSMRMPLKMMAISGRETGVRPVSTRGRIGRIVSGSLWLMVGTTLKNTKTSSFLEADSMIVSESQ